LLFYPLNAIRSSSRRGDFHAGDPFSDIVDTVSDLIYVVGADGSFLRVNRAWKETWGTGRGSGGLKAPDIVNPGSRERHAELLARAFAGEAPQEAELMMTASAAGPSR